jgi:hypothetical protein
MRKMPFIPKTGRKPDKPMEENRSVRLFLIFSFHAVLRAFAVKKAADL